MQAEPDSEKKEPFLEASYLWQQKRSFQSEIRAFSFKHRGTKNSLCLVPVVTGLDIWSAGRYRKVTPSSKVISRPPRLRSLPLDPDDNERKDEMIRNHLREGIHSPLPVAVLTPKIMLYIQDTLTCIEFALSLAEWPKSLRYLCLQYTGNSPENHNISPFIRSAAGKDSLSLALNALSQQLETILLLSVSIGPEIFWPPIQKTQPYWPRLSHFKLVIQPLHSLDHGYSQRPEMEGTVTQ